MSQRTLPLLFFNLGGEMLYILQQRLHAQNVLTAKANKVMEDMVTTMFSEQWMEELFKPWPLFSVDGLKVLFQKVAHSSIMRLNNVAMEKLYDLISMGFKYQLLACPKPEDMILITLNHLDTLKTFVSESEMCCEMIHIACRKLNEHYSPLSKAEFIEIRSTILSLLQDSNRRISVLLRQNLQHQNGVFVIPVGGAVPIGFEIPGTIRYYTEEGDVSHTDQFLPTHHYTPPTKQGSWEVSGDRGTQLGCNIYTLTGSSSSHRKHRTVSEGVLARPSGAELGVRVQKKLEEVDEESEQNGTPRRTQNESASDSLVNVELTLLHKMLASPPPGRGTTFKLNLFPHPELDEDGISGNEASGSDPASERDKSSRSVLQLETLQNGTEELNKIRDDLTITDTVSSGADDLLDLLDQATA